MSHQPAIDELVEDLTALSDYEDPMLPIYKALGPEQPLTLRAIRDHSQLLRECTGRAEDQVETIQRVIERCQQLRPTPLPNLPLGF